MLLNKLIDFRSGIVQVTSTRGNFVRFLNICTSKGIELRKIHYIEKTIQFEIAKRDFKALRHIAKKTGCKLKISRKWGLPFKLRAIKARKGFIAGVFVFIIIIFIMSSFIWKIRIEGNAVIPNEEILKVLMKSGIRSGALKYKIDTKKSIENILFEIPNVSWVFVSIKGSVLNVSIAERKDEPQIVPKDSPCNIIAIKGGMIEKISVKEGTDLVKIGSTIEKGQILVSAEVEIKGKLEKHLVHSMAEVSARTWYEVMEKIVQRKEEKIETGIIENRYKLSLFGKKIKVPLFHKLNSKYDTKIINNQLTLWDGFILPIGYEKTENREYKIIVNNLTLDEARKIAENKATKEVYAQIPQTAQIVESKILLLSNESGEQFVDVIVECTEEVGMKQKIGQN